MEQIRLFRLAPETMHIQATFVAGAGWHVSVIMRRQGESWSDAYDARYSHLTTSELADVICEEVVQQLQT